MKNNIITTYILITIILFGYIAPWLITPTSPLTLGAYDLAEWTTLHPSQPHTSPALIVAFMIRLQLVLITLMIACIARSNTIRGIITLLIIILSIAQLPPLEFITEASGNINYQQQFLFASISLIVGLLLTFFKPLRFVPTIIAGIVIISIPTAIIGLMEAQKLYTMSLIENSIGMGIVIFVAGYITLFLLNLRNISIAKFFKQPEDAKQGSI